MHTIGISRLILVYLVHVRTARSFLCLFNSFSIINESQALIPDLPTKFWLWPAQGVQNSGFEGRKTAMDLPMLIDNNLRVPFICICQIFHH